MFIKQLSIFVENREGRLENALKVLKNNEINIVSLSLADNTDYGMLRMIVSKPDVARKVLKEEGFTAMLTDVVAVKLSHKSGKLQEILEIICKAGINVEYMYALATGSDDASIVIKPSDPSLAIEIIKDEKIELFTQVDADNEG